MERGVECTVVCVYLSGVTLSPQLWDERLCATAYGSVGRFQSITSEASCGVAVVPHNSPTVPCWMLRGEKRQFR